MENVEIRSAYMQAGLKQWQLAEALGISETHFSRKLRKELPQAEKDKILGMIQQISRDKQEVV